MEGTAALRQNNDPILAAEGPNHAQDPQRSGRQGPQPQHRRAQCTACRRHRSVPADQAGALRVCGQGSGRDRTRGGRVRARIVSDRAYPINKRASPCSRASGVPYRTTTSPSRKMVVGSGCRPTMPSRRIAVMVTSPRFSDQIGQTTCRRSTHPAEARQCAAPRADVRLVRSAKRIVRAEHAPQHRVAIVADVADRLHDARHRHVEQQQHVRHQHQARFQRFWNDLRRAGLLQRFELGIVLRAHEHGQRRDEARAPLLRCAAIRPGRRTSAPARCNVRARRLPGSRSARHRRR